MMAATAAPAVFSGNRDALASAAPFPHTWVPLASTFELEPDRPTPLKFLNRRYVAYRDNDANWVVMDDACPHRLAPLSEGRIDRETNCIECAYHGWAFKSCGSCARIPQATDAVAQAATRAPGARVASYPVIVEKSILWAWLWPEEPATRESKPAAHPEAMVAGVDPDASTYTRDVPYGWDTLLENIVDPSHIPFAHHGLQGKRTDAIPINMSLPAALGGGGGPVDERGFAFEFGDRTMGLRRAGSGEFRAPFTVAYNAEYANSSRTFNLTVVCVPTAPGWSRAIIYGGASPERRKERAKAEAAARRASGAPPPPPPPKTSLVGRVFRALPVWAVHLGSNRFLDSDLAFLHYQEQAVLSRNAPSAAGAYYMPAPADRCIAALRKWMEAHAHVLGPLPPPIETRAALFDRWSQHTAHCRHCTAALAGLRRWRTNTYRLLALALLGAHKLWLARLVGVVCLGLLRVYALVEQQFKFADYEHWKNA